MTSQPPRYRGYRFPPEIISHAVWLYHRFCLSFRDVEDLLAQRGVTVSYETIRQWCQTFGLDYARQLRRRRGRMGDTWYLDELFVTMQGRRHYLWRAVDQDGDVCLLDGAGHRALAPSSHQLDNAIRPALAAINGPSAAGPSRLATACRRTRRMHLGCPACDGRPLLPSSPRLLARRAR